MSAAARRSSGVHAHRRLASLLRSSLAVGPAAGDAGDEILRICGENLELGQLQRAQRRCEGLNAGNGEPPAQAIDGGLVLGSGVARCGDLEARIAENAMDGFAGRFAGPEIGNQGVVELKRAGLACTSRGGVVQGKVAGERDRLAFAGCSVTACRSRSPTA